MENLSKKSKILIVEDNVATLDLLVTYLSRHDFEIITARSGPMGLRRARHVLPHLILLDVMLPEMDGFEVCRQLKSDPTTRDIPVIFLTVRASPLDNFKGFEVGAVDYVVKPFKSQDLLARVNAHLAITHLHQALETEVQRREAAEQEVQDLSDALQHAKSGGFPQS